MLPGCDGFACMLAGKIFCSRVILKLGAGNYFA